jgi:superfamily II DNA or RNA helicase
MQVITLLVVIAESSASPDESVRSQIPENLLESKTLILCPASLVDNWYEEIQLWAPGDILGPVQKMHSTRSTADRVPTIQKWAQYGGVLIIGYNLFSNLVRDDEEVAKMLHETPNLVIGDEAHSMKNPESQRHQAAANFKTMSRIAMTGSPLTKNVMDYYSMINWVAPRYLADVAEFKQRFSNPIKEGLYADSDPYQKRKARKLLQVLKATVEPKVHRRDVDVLFSELPKKKEFIITLPLTKIQTRLYTKYIELATDPGREPSTGQARAWVLVAKLRLVLAHPFIFKTNAEAQLKAKKNGIKAESSMSTPGDKTGEGEDEEMPQDILHEMLAIVAIREIEDYALSNKILILLRILRECKKVGDKVLIFSNSIATLDYIENLCKRQRVVYQRLDGGTRIATRQDSIKKFNTDPSSEVYLISTTAGGVGLNIYGANRVVIFDYGYTPANEKQAIGRAYRLGQTKPVHVYWFKIGGTFEDTIENNAIFKTQLASRVVDKKNPDPYSTRSAEYFLMPREVPQKSLAVAEGHDPVLDALLKDEDIRKHIRQITSTETFEKEETYELTPEEQKEVEADVKLELLRSQDPEEFRRQERQRLEQSRIQLGMPPSLPLAPGFCQPCPANGESHAALQSTSDRKHRVVRIKVPEHLRDKPKPGPPVPTVVSGDSTPPNVELPLRPDPQQQVLTPTSVPAQSNQPAPFTLRPTTATVALPLVQPPPVQGSPAAGQQPMASPNPNGMNDTLTQMPKATAVPQPILGTGTHFKVSPQAQSPPGPPTALPTALPNGPPTLGSTPAAPPMVIENMGFDWSGVFAVHSTVCQEGRHVRHHPNDLLARLQEILTRDKVERLPMTDKMQNLSKVSRNERFAEAMLSGYLDPEQLASMTRLEMEEISRSLSGMSPGEFKQRVWTTKANLNVCTGTKST